MEPRVAERSGASPPVLLCSGQRCVDCQMPACQSPRAVPGDGRAVFVSRCTSVPERSYYTPWKFEGGGGGGAREEFLGPPPPLPPGGGLTRDVKVVGERARARTHLDRQKFHRPGMDEVESTRNPRW